MHAQGAERATTGPGTDGDQHVVGVLISSPLPQLDRLFDYAVPAELAAGAVVGSGDRVDEVPFRRHVARCARREDVRQTVSDLGDGGAHAMPNPSGCRSGANIICAFLTAIEPT